MEAKEAIAKCLAKLDEIDPGYTFGGVFQVLGEKDGVHATVWCAMLAGSYCLSVWISKPWSHLRGEMQLTMPDDGRSLGEVAKQHAPALMPLAVEAARVAGIEVEA